MIAMVDAFHIESPAKVNLRLEVLRKREDGYHEIRTLFQKISLHDTLHFSLNRRKGVRIRTDHVGLPTGRKNLVYHAARSMLDRSNYGGGIDIHIEKRIPLGAGLGGGSSNAAAALKALNELLNANLSQKELMVLGEQIGADVPFFLLEGSAIGSGIGERLRKITLPRLCYLLLNPGFEVSARWAYQNFVLTKTKYHFNLHGLLKSSMRISGLLYNDLEGVVSAKYQEIALMKEMLLSAGATGALMTGSGPTVFGLFSGEKKAKDAYERLERKVRGRGWRIFQAQGIP
jgi:4-diphosphocytidyl-2-C-methyl-D-erythritol kinase